MGPKNIVIPYTRTARGVRGLRNYRSRLKGSTMKSKLGLLAVLLAAAGMAAPAAAHEAGTWIVRGGAGMVDPQSNNGDFGDVDLGDGTTLVNSHFEVDDDTSIVISFTYMLLDNWGIDILVATPFEHDIDLTGTVNGSSVTARVGSTEHLPPTLSLQYHFMPDAAFQPYFGLGVNYTIFSSEEVTQFSRDVGLVGISLDDSSGIAAQLGADWVFHDDWLASFDVRWMQIRSDLEIDVDDAGTIITGINVPGNVEIDPWVYSLTLGRRF